MSDYETDKYVKHLESQIEKLQGENERLKELGYTTLNDYREESKMRIEAEKELAQLTAKHDRLFVVLEDLRNFSLNSNGVDLIGLDHVISAVKKLLAEEGNV